MLTSTEEYFENNILFMFLVFWGAYKVGALQKILTKINESADWGEISRTCIFVAILQY